MTWTFTSTDPSNDRDRVRILSGDTDTTDQLVQDEWITELLSIEGGVRGAAASVMEHLAARFARKADKEVGDLSLRLSQRSKMYADQAKRMRELEDSHVTGAPLVGGISEDRKETVEDDDDRVKPAFKVGMLSNPRAFGRTSDDDFWEEQ